MSREQVLITVDKLSKRGTPVAHATQRGMRGKARESTAAEHFDGYAASRVGAAVQGVHTRSTVLKRDQLANRCCWAVRGRSWYQSRPCLVPPLCEARRCLVPRVYPLRPRLTLTHEPLNP